MRAFAFRGAATTLGFIQDNLRGAHTAYRMAKGTSYGRSRRIPARNAKSLGIGSRSKRTAAVSKFRRVKRVVVKPKRKSFTRTKRRTSYKAGRGGFSSALAKTGGSSFSIGSGAKLYRGFKRAQQPVTFTSTTTQRVTGAAGKQAVAVLPTYRINPGANDPTNDTALIGTNTLDSVLLDRAERWLQAYQESTPATAASAQSSPGMYQTNKFVVNHLKYDQAIRNCEVQDVTLTIYDCVLRPGVAPNIRSPGSVNQSISPINDWHIGLQNEYNPAAPVAYLSQTFDSPATTPFHSTHFCKLYKIKKTTKVTLAPGAVHHHHVTVKPRNMFDTQTSGNVNSALYTADRGYLIPGISGFTLITVLGSIGDSAANHLLIGTTKTAVDVVTTTMASFSQFSRERRMHMAFDGLTQATDLQAVQPDTGTIQMDTTANEA
ncbi:capsid protein [Bromus-associated circular DNA virus 1]|nr:capsid protein [Bromus-associated circular DNA virus 1]